MNALKTIDKVKDFCKANSGSEQIWAGNKNTYQWSLGKTTNQGVVNGVVRKLAGIDVSGKQIWAVAGSLKILADGTISRFTGLSKATQNSLNSNLVEETVSADKVEDHVSTEA
jgi:hypothetical protein